MTGTTRSTKTATAPAAPKANRRGTATPPAPVDGLAALQAAASAVAAAGKVKAPKAEAIKAQARRDLAQLLVSAYASAFSEIPADSPIFVALGRETAAQFASNWVHHLPITAAAFGDHLPIPARSNWDGDKRK